MRMIQLSLYSLVRFILASSLQVMTLSLSLHKLTEIDVKQRHTHTHSHTSCCIVFVVGSTDCVCYATVGVIDPVTSALHIIIGEDGSSLK